MEKLSLDAQAREHLERAAATSTGRSATTVYGGNGHTLRQTLLALTDAQAQKLWYIVKNGDWSLELRPTKDPADSPESAEKAETLLVDGVTPGQLKALNAAGGLLFRNGR